jgi:ATP-binding cassette subfamily F protein uup
VTVTLGLDGSGKVDIVAGGYEDWEAKRAKRAAPVKKAAKAEPAPPPPSAPKSTKLSYKDQRDYDLLPARIEELDAEIAKGEHALADPDLYNRNPSEFARMTALLDKLRAEKDAAEERWLVLAETVEG